MNETIFRIGIGLGDNCYARMPKDIRATIEHIKKILPKSHRMILHDATHSTDISGYLKELTSILKPFRIMLWMGISEYNKCVATDSLHSSTFLSLTEIAESIEKEITLDKLFGFIIGDPKVKRPDGFEAFISETSSFSDPMPVELLKYRYGWYSNWTILTIPQLCSILGMEADEVNDLLKAGRWIVLDTMSEEERKQARATYSSNIEELNLSAFTLDSLKNAGYTVIADVAANKEAVKSMMVLSEVEKRFEENGLKFTDDMPSADESITFECNYPPAFTATPRSGIVIKRAPTIHTWIWESDFPADIRKILSKNKILTISQLVELSAYDLSIMEGMNETFIKEIISILKANDLALAPDENIDAISMSEQQLAAMKQLYKDIFNDDGKMPPDFKACVEYALCRLNEPCDAGMIRMRYGFDSDTMQSVKNVAAFYNMSEEDAQTAITEILERMKTESYRLLRYGLSGLEIISPPAVDMRTRR